MIIVMNMGDYEIEQDELEIEYGEEIMNAGWNPEVDSVHEQLQILTDSEMNTIPDDLATASAELFLRKMYSYQR